jgi:tripartite-type tricarboxylate transporter receptor subunit TctC
VSSRTGVTRRTVLIGGTVTAASVFLAACGGVQTGGGGGGGGEFPQRSVEFIIPFAPGGSTDLIGRAATKQIREPLGQPMVVVNKPGAGGAVGTKEAVDSKPDGYKVALAPTSLFTITPVVRAEPSGLDINEMEIVTGLTRENLVLVVHKDSPYKTIDDLLKAKGNSKPLTFGHSGVGAGTHFSALMFLRMAGINAKDVPFDGSGPSVNALLGKQIDMASTQIAESIKQVQSGNLRQLALFSEQRSELLPDIPTVKEKGFDFTVDQVRFVAAPKGTPEQAVTKLRDAFLESTKDPAYEKFLKDNFIQRAEMSGEEIRQKVETDLARYQELAQKLGIKPE